MNPRGRRFPLYCVAFLFGLTSLALAMSNGRKANDMQQMMPQILVAASASIILLLGLLHLAYMFFTRKLNPRDAELEMDMRQALPRITSQTTMWKAWIGFNASHSAGIILFGAIYAYLSLFAWTLLVHSAFFIRLGIAFFVSYSLLAKLYWFRRPLIFIALAGLLYVLGIVIAIR